MMQNGLLGQAHCFIATAANGYDSFTSARDADLQARSSVLDGLT
jgi:hypothetical protein